ncbi:MAG TPA: hypothetical protein VL126_12080 [Bacteroidota bacterium]|nr:hypothetical protein [Bacteroidota bacterium]
MDHLNVRRSFVLFHLTLGIVILVQSVRTALRADFLHDGNPLGSHLVVLATIEAIAALLFLIPRTLKIGSILLFAVFAFVLLIHGIMNQLDLLVYAAGVLFVFFHGSAFGRGLSRKATP